VAKVKKSKGEISCVDSSAYFERFNLGIQTLFMVAEKEEETKEQ